MTRINISPPTSALPQLPLSRLQTPLSMPEFSRQQSASPIISQFPPKTPSKIVKSSTSSSNIHAPSSPKAPTLRSNSTNQVHNQGENSLADKEIRRSVSIANFPQPPKARRTGLGSKYSTATHSLISEANARSKDGSDLGAGSLRIKRLKTKASTDGLGQMYGGGPTLTLLNGSGDGKAISSALETGVSNELASLQSLPHSRTSSAQGSYSTSATTFEDTDDKRPMEEWHANRKDGSKSRDSGQIDHDRKGNVIVSVRVRPDAGVEKSSGKDWMVDSRQSLVAYRGREGGDYYFGKPMQSHYPTSSPNLLDVALQQSHRKLPIWKLRITMPLYLKTD